MISNLDTMKRSCDDLIDLIFNTVGTLQNESMKQLTLVTVFFMPLTFVAGYFGMNFDDFSAIKNSDAYFWYIAAPVAIFTSAWLLRDIIVRKFVKAARKRDIRVAKKKRRKMEENLRGFVGERNGSRGSGNGSRRELI